MADELRQRTSADNVIDISGDGQLTKLITTPGNGEKVG
jgi:hypothetical protein